VTTQTATSTWTIDPVHSTVEFGLVYMGLQTYKARFRTVDGTIAIDEAQPENSSVAASIDVKSIDVLGDRFAGHIHGEEFFNTEQYPNITFKSAKVEKVDDKHWKIHGDLTIKGTTKHVDLDTQYLGQAVHPYSKKPMIDFVATTSINREDFGIKWNPLLDNGARYVGEHVNITLNVHAAKQD
jgi:polyisoprenoid-binding protein YceI